MSSQKKGESHGLEPLFEKDDRGLLEATNVPARMFRLVLLETKLTKAQWTRLLNKATKKEGVNKSDSRGNLIRSIRGDSITWLSMRRGLQVLGPEQILVTMRLEWNPRLEFGGEKPGLIAITSDSRRDDLLRIFHEGILTRTQISPSAWNELNLRHLDHLGLRSAERRSEGSDRISNLKKILGLSTSTGKHVRQIRWEKFCEALMILQIRQVTLSVTLKFRKRETQHTLYFRPEDEVDDT